MDPISLAVGAIGLGVSAFGMFGASSASKKASDIQNSILAEQTAENQVRQQYVNMQAQRSQIQNVRNTQRAQAQGLTASVSQGAQFGSGAAGGQAQASAAGAWNAEGISQSLISANRIFGIDYQIDQLKGQLGAEDATMQSYKGMQSLGGSLLGSAQSIGRLAGGLGGGGAPQGTDVTGGLFNSLNRFPF